MMGIALPETEQGPDFEVWPDNWEIVEMFLRVQTQWNMSFGGITGLNYASVLAIMDMYKYDDPVTVFEDLQVLEVTALRLLNKEDK